MKIKLVEVNFYNTNGKELGEKELGEALTEGFEIKFINKRGDIKKLPLLLKTEIASLLLDDIINAI